MNKGGEKLETFFKGGTTIAEMGLRVLFRGHVRMFVDTIFQSHLSNLYKQI